MSVRRLAGTAVGMGLAAAVLAVLTPDLSWLADFRGNLQDAVDRAGPEALVLSGVALLAWAAWAWGALGLALTALSVLPGAVGAAARGTARVLLPAGARRAAALALGVGLATGSPVLAGCGWAPAHAAPLAAATVIDRSLPGAPDWPLSPGVTAPAPTRDDAVPDWPPPAAGEHVVLAGECLWDIAQRWLHDRFGRSPTVAEVAAAVEAWWTANAAVIGADPDLLLPGQVLRPPAAP
ncbi:MAG TPA: hypothetical protein VHF92_12475 [Geodermatophilus sp.]|nr:hypothetical protein [Geodermatophilus sp.]